MLSLRYDAFCRSQRRAVFWEGQRAWRAMKRISVFWEGQRAWRAMKHVPRFLGRTAGLASNETRSPFFGKDSGFGEQ